jgi:hypothetical protein
VLCLAFLFGGCAALLDGENVKISAHEGVRSSPPSENPAEITDYPELITQLKALVANHREVELFRILSYDGDLEADILRARSEIMETYPLGVYAVDDISGIVTKIVSYYDLDVNIFYRRDAQPFDSIITASTLRYLKSELLSILSGYSAQAAVLIRIAGITEEDILSYISEAYYENPRSIIMLPVASVEFFPETGEERIAEIEFAYRYPEGILRAYNAYLDSALRNAAESVSGTRDGDILYELLLRLIDFAEYDTTSEGLGEYSTQNFLSTAYGALVNGSATGDGFAMAYKALCDEMGISCTAVLGTLAGAPHAWSIVFLEGSYYHIDAAMSTQSEPGAAFLKNDTEMRLAGYRWATADYPVCAGPLTAGDFIPEPPEPGDDEPDVAPQNK